ncbi:MAG TPA: GntG family PLP-dependent aldolase [Chloroflexaceae bacterium]|mgnify:CR=1 FL=1|nr:GntG family PLP-dependent aldolase [Chloroflexaceae bacterium]
MTDQPIDMRSDAVTQPTEAMWAAMRRAAPGWAPAGDDPAVRELEAYAAELAGKAAALFAPTGTMANLAALMATVERGDQVLLEASSHILWSEEWGLAYICGAVPRALPSADGCPDPELVRAAIVERRFSHRPRTALLCLENSHNVAGGAAIPARRIAAAAEAARAHGVPAHLDGARLMNAAVALGEPPAALAAPVASLTLGVSKGLGAPYGALLVGPAALVARARVALRRLGGHSVPNAGPLAAAALVALRDMPPQLARDHGRARALAAGLAALPGLALDPAGPQTNIVMARVAAPGLDAPELLRRLAARGVFAVTLTDEVLRFVTHRHIGDAEVARAVDAVREALREGA